MSFAKPIHHVEIRHELWAGTRCRVESSPKFRTGVVLPGIAEAAFSLRCLIQDQMILAYSVSRKKENLK